MFCVGGFVGQFMATSTAQELGTIAAFLLPLAISTELFAIWSKDRRRNRLLNQIAKEGTERCAKTAAACAASPTS